MKFVCSFKHSISPVWLQSIGENQCKGKEQQDGSTCPVEGGVAVVMPEEAEVPLFLQGHVALLVLGLLYHLIQLIMQDPQGVLGAMAYYQLFTTHLLQPMEQSTRNVCYSSSKHEPRRLQFYFWPMMSWTDLHSSRCSRYLFIYNYYVDIV